MGKQLEQEKGARRQARLSCACVSFRTAAFRRGFEADRNKHLLGEIMRACLGFLLLIVALLHCTIAVLGYAEHRLNDTYKL